MTKAQIEKKWGVTIIDDSYFDGFDRYVKAYRMYSADGCSWENGLRTIKAVEEECRKWSDALLGIKATVEAKKWRAN